MKKEGSHYCLLSTVTMATNNITRTTRTYTLSSLTLKIKVITMRDYTHNLIRGLSKEFFENANHLINAIERNIRMRYIKTNYIASSVAIEKLCRRGFQYDLLALRK